MIYFDRVYQPHEKPEGVKAEWRPSIYGLLTNEKGEWLMVKPSWGDRYDFPGGGVNVDESIFDGLKREVFEETGFRVHVDQTPLYMSEENFFDVRHDSQGAYYHALIMIFHVRLADGGHDPSVVNTTEGFEIEKQVWIDPKTLTKENVHPIYWPFVEKMQNN